MYGWLEVGEIIENLPLPPRSPFLRIIRMFSFFEDEVHPNRIYVSSLIRSESRRLPDGIAKRRADERRRTPLAMVAP